MMQRKRLDVQIGAERYDYIKDESDRTGVPMNMIADDLLSIGIAVKRGEVIEQQSLPVIREIVQTELRKANAQLRTDMREDMQLEFTGEIKALLRAQSDRLAALIVRTFRHANITRGSAMPCFPNHTALSSLATSLRMLPKRRAAIWQPGQRKKKERAHDGRSHCFPDRRDDPSLA